MQVVRWPWTDGKTWAIDGETRLVKEAEAYYLDQDCGGLIESIRLSEEMAKKLVEVLSNGL